MLRELGFSVEEASNGEVALEKLGQSEYDILVTDMQMPGMNGDKLISAAREMGFQSRIFLITGEIGKEVDMSKSWREQISGVIEKPFSFVKLNQVLNPNEESLKKSG